MDVADHLKNRMEIIGEIVGSVGVHSHPTIWRWEKFKRTEGIKVEKFKDAGAEILWQRKGDDGWGRILASNITPHGKIANRKDVDILLGEKLIDSLTADALNYDGVVAVPITYDGTFRKLKGLEEAFDYGLTQSIEISLGYSYGSEAAQNKFTAELKIGFESRQDWHHQETTEDEQARSAGISPESPPKWDIRYKLDRYGQSKKLKSSRLVPSGSRYQDWQDEARSLEGETTASTGRRGRAGQIGIRFTRNSCRYQGRGGDATWTSRCGFGGIRSIPRSSPSWRSRSRLLGSIRRSRSTARRALYNLRSSSGVQIHSSPHDFDHQASGCSVGPFNSGGDFSRRDARRYLHLRGESATEHGRTARESCGANRTHLPFNRKTKRREAGA